MEQGLHEFEHRLSHDDPEVLKDEKKLEKLKKEERGKIIGNLRVAYAVEALTGQYGIKAEQEDVQRQFFLQAYMMRQNPTEFLETEVGRRLMSQIEQNVVTGMALSQLASEIFQKGESGGKGQPASKGKE